MMLPTSNSLWKDLVPGFSGLGPEIAPLSLLTFHKTFYLGIPSLLIF